MIIVEQIENGNKGAFRAIDNQTIAGEMTYSHAGPDKIIIDHTEVNPDYKGQGIGTKLLSGAVDYARKNHLKIMPLCPFAKSVFDKDPSLGDVLF